MEGLEEYTNHITQDDVIKIRDRTVDLVAYGKAVFEDAFGETHESRFCYYYALPFEDFRVDLRAPTAYHLCT
jgi:hypothetical protein